MGTEFVVVRVPPGEERRYVVEMAPFVRAADRLEVRRSSGEPLIPVLIRSAEASPLTWYATLDGEPAAMFGVLPVNLVNGVGVPWMISCEAVDRNRRGFLRESRRWVARMRRSFPVLVNWVDAEYMSALRWAKRIGFRVWDPEPYGRSGEPFHCISMGVSDV